MEGSSSFTVRYQCCPVCGACNNRVRALPWRDLQPVEASPAVARTRASRRALSAQCPHRRVGRFKCAAEGDASPPWSLMGRVVRVDHMRVAEPDALWGTTIISARGLSRLQGDEFTEALEVRCAGCWWKNLVICEKRSPGFHGKVKAGGPRRYCLRCCQASVAACAA